MLRTTLLSTAAFAAIAFPAFADGKGAKNLIALGDIGYDFTSFSDFDIDQDTFHGRGSVLWPLEGNWNVQGNFGFNADRVDTPGPSFAPDTWNAGATAFWRSQNEGVLGGELWYQSLDLGSGYADGFGIAARGEYFLSQQATLGARVAYSNFDQSTFEIDEWTVNAFGRYYARPNLGLTLGLNYSSLDNGSGGEGFDDWSLRGEAEYLFDDCDTSVYASLMYGNLDSDTGSESDHWGLGLGVRLHFGTSGALVQRHRTGPLEELQSARFIF
jgi:hypothetical protein